VSSIVQIIVYSIYFRISPIKTSYLLIVKCFDEEDLEGGLKKTIWLRWLFFILGALPQAVKLGSFGGVPWTQFLGFCYLASFVLVEILIFIASIWNEQLELTRRLRANPALNSYEAPGSLLRYVDTSLLVFSFYNTILIGEVTRSLVFSAIDLGIRPSTGRIFMLHEPGVVSTFIILICCTCAIGIFLVLLFAGFLSLLVKVMPWMIRRIPRSVGANLIVVFPAGDGSKFNVDVIAVGCLLFFVFHSSSVIFLYWRLFSSDGTEKPSWTGVYG
jgi:hypothetical protein